MLFACSLRNSLKSDMVVQIVSQAIRIYHTLSNYSLRKVEEEIRHLKVFSTLPCPRRIIRERSKYWREGE